jgi:hypothetical protein
MAGPGSFAGADLLLDDAGGLLCETLTSSAAMWATDQFTGIDAQRLGQPPQYRDARGNLSTFT